ncbi:hypothetical protein WA577_004452 [Blastocystis sp. JDR]
MPRTLPKNETQPAPGNGTVAVAVNANPAPKEEVVSTVPTTGANAGQPASGSKSFFGSMKEKVGVGDWNHCVVGPARKQEKLAKKQAKKEAAEKRLQEKIDMRGYCIRRILVVMTIQLIVTTIILWALATIQVVQDLFTKYYWPVFIVSLIGTYVITCNIKKIKGHPLDIIMLACFTVFESLLGSSCIHFMDHRIMLGGMVITIIATAALAVYTIAMQSDLSGAMPYVLALAVVAICFFFSYLLKLIPTNIFVYIIVPLFSVYVVYDIQTGVKLKEVGDKYAPDVYVNICSLQMCM